MVERTSEYPLLPIDLPDKFDWEDGKTYRLLSKVDHKRPTFARAKNPNKNGRQKCFERKVLVQISSALASTRIPLQFRMKNKQVRKLDEGCVGHAIANKTLLPPDKDDGYIELAGPSEFGDNFDSDADAEVQRLKKLGRLGVRPGQKAFSRKIRWQYNGRCAVTGCRTAASLQAAHIRTDEQNDQDYNSDDNGILLRSDVHLLLDAFLITFSSDGKKIELSSSLVDDSYSFLKAACVKSPKFGRTLSLDNINYHRRLFKKAHSGS